ncbi:DUF6233 domain-containing protein [Streptomyces sp. MAI_2237]
MTAGCAGGHLAVGKRRRPVDRDEARRLLTDGLRACSHCWPEARLDIGLPTSRAAVARLEQSYYLARDPPVRATRCASGRTTRNDVTWTGLARRMEGVTVRGGARNSGADRSGTSAG